MKGLELGVAHQQPGRTRGDVHAPDAIVGGRERQRERAAGFAVADGLVRHVQAPVVDRQGPGAAGRHHVHRHGQHAALQRVHIHHHRAKARVAGCHVAGAGVVDQLAARGAIEPLQLAAHLPVPGAGLAHGMEAVAVFGVEVANRGPGLGRQALVHPGRALGRKQAVAAVPVGLVVVAKKMVLAAVAHQAAGHIGGGRGLGVGRHTKSGMQEQETICPAKGQAAQGTAGALSRPKPALPESHGPSGLFRQSQRSWHRPGCWPRRSCPGPPGPCGTLAR